jgi:hypothetical protein
MKSERWSPALLPPRQGLRRRSVKPTWASILERCLAASLAKPSENQCEGDGVKKGWSDEVVGRCSDGDQRNELDETERNHSYRPIFPPAESRTRVIGKGAIWQDASGRKRRCPRFLEGACPRAPRGGSQPQLVFCSRFGRCSASVTKARGRAPSRNRGQPTPTNRLIAKLAGRGFRSQSQQGSRPCALLQLSGFPYNAPLIGRWRL